MCIRFRPAQAREEVLGLAEGAAGDRAAGLSRPEALGVDTVVNLRNAMQRNPDLTLEVVLQVTRQRDITADERPVEAAHVLIAATRSIRIREVPAVLAVDANRNTRRPGRHGGLERREVAGMHDGRAQPAEQPIKPRVIAHQMARALVELDEL